jgi:hypothetical protein
MLDEPNPTGPPSPRTAGFAGKTVTIGKGGPKRRLKSDLVSGVRRNCQYGAAGQGLARPTVRVAARGTGAIVDIRGSEPRQAQASDPAGPSKGVHDLAVSTASCWNSGAYSGPSGSGESGSSPGGAMAGATAPAFFWARAARPSPGGAMAPALRQLIK